MAHPPFLSLPPLLLQGKRHQQNLAKRAAKEASEAPVAPAPARRATLRKTAKIGRPGYRVTKQCAGERGGGAIK